MRRFFPVLTSSDPGLLSLVAVLLLAAIACRFFMEETDPVPQGKTVVTFCKGGTKRDRVEYRELREAFERLNPDIHLKIIHSNVERKPDTMLAAGIPPDVIWIGCDRVDYYLEADALLDLTPYIKADAELNAALFGGPNGEPPDFYPQTVEPFVRGGRLPVVPVNYTPFIIYYSKDLFDRHHVPYPDENWDWEGLRQRALALTRDRSGRRPDQPGFDRTQVVSYGFQYAKWQHGPENFIRQNGGRLISEDGTRVVADDPRTVEAVQFLYDLKFKDGVCPPGQNPARQDISIARNTLGMHLSGVFSIPTLREQAPNLDWDIAPLPRGPDGRRAAIVYSYAWGITKKCPHPEAAFKLLKFIVSSEGMAISGRHQVFLPARRSAAAAWMAGGTQHKPRSTWVLTHGIDYGYAELPFSTKQWYGEVYECINEHFDKLLALDRPPFTPREACESMTREGNSILRRDRTVPRTTLFGWGAIALALVPAAWLSYRFVRRRPRGMSALALREERWGYGLVLPWVLGFLVFAAGPILISIALSFAQWQSLSEFTRTEFIGVENYRVALSGEDPKFWPSLWVTFRYALVAVPLGLAAGLALALLMNQAVRGIALFRTVYYVPAVLPAVATAVLWWHLFDTNHGWMNRVLHALNEAGPLNSLIGGWLSGLATGAGEDWPIGWLSSPAFVPWVFVVMSLWAVGGGMIIYLAGLQSIPTQLYEAAEIDGAGRWAQLRHVTLPMISPVIFFNLVMGIIASFQVFNAAFVLFDGFTGPNDSALFYGLHLFREAFYKYRLGYASALAWILFALILLLTAVVFKSSPMWVYYETARARRPAEAEPRAGGRGPRGATSGTERPLSSPAELPGSAAPGVAR